MEEKNDFGHITKYTYCCQDDFIITLKKYHYC